MYNIRLFGIVTVNPSCTTDTNFKKMGGKKRVVWARDV
jgi:hypothetical protein